MSTPKARTDAAQAVYEAAHEAWATKDDPSSIAAAALRAAAPMMQFVQDHKKLLAIATELEGHHG
jgi:hypothetical protein